jgi:SAM-dependent methyltransferase
MSLAGRLTPLLRRRFQTSRADLFLELLQPPRGARVLDLGGGAGFLSSLIAQRRPDLGITVADVEPTRLTARELYGFAERALDPDGPLPFDDNSFDVVLCNSVIEHVTLPKDRCLNDVLPEPEWRAAALARQMRFAAEIRRVGRGYFVQTPHRSFPFDVHVWLPFTSWLSHEAARRLIRVTDRFWVKKCGVADWHLLGWRDMAALFPGGTVTVERFFGLPKSLIAWRKGI